MFNHTTQKSHLNENKEKMPFNYETYERSHNERQAQKKQSSFVMDLAKLMLVGVPTAAAVKWLTKKDSTNSKDIMLPYEKDIKKQQPTGMVSPGTAAEVAAARVEAAEVAAARAEAAEVAAARAEAARVEAAAEAVRVEAAAEVEAAEVEAAKAAAAEAAAAEVEAMKAAKAAEVEAAVEAAAETARVEAARVEAAAEAARVEAAEVARVARVAKAEAAAATEAAEVAAAEVAAAETAAARAALDEQERLEQEKQVQREKELKRELEGRGQERVLVAPSTTIEFRRKIHRFRKLASKAARILYDRENEQVKKKENWVDEPGGTRVSRKRERDNVFSLLFKSEKFNINKRCSSFRAEFKELVRNSDTLAVMTCEELVSYAENWESNVRLQNPAIYNPQLKKIFLHMAALIKLKAATADTSSEIGRIARLMTPSDSARIESQGLEIFDVLNVLNLGMYNFKDSFLANMFVFSYFKFFKPGTSDVLIRKLDSVFGVEDLTVSRYGVLLPKQWHASSRYDSALSIGKTEICRISKQFIYEPNSENVDLDSVELASMAVILEAQQQAQVKLGVNEVALTAVVSVQTHGSYECNNSISQELRIYRIPPGKTLTVVSMATPTEVAILFAASIENRIDQIRNFVYRSNIANMFIDPVFTAKHFIRNLVRSKRAVRQLLKTSSLTEDLPEKRVNFLQNYTDPRIVAFAEGDACIDKLFTFNDVMNSQVTKFNFLGWDQDLFPHNGKEYTLGKMCDYLFLTEGHTNVLLFDESCSVIKISQCSNIQSSPVSAHTKAEIRSNAQRLFMGGYTEM